MSRDKPSSPRGRRSFSFPIRVEVLESRLAAGSLLSMAGTILADLAVGPLPSLGSSSSQLTEPSVGSVSSLANSHAVNIVDRIGGASLGEHSVGLSASIVPEYQRLETLATAIGDVKLASHMSGDPYVVTDFALREVGFAQHPASDKKLSTSPRTSS